MKNINFTQDYLSSYAIKILMVITVFTIIGLSGCTSKVWKQSKVFKVVEGKDTIRSMLMSQDGKLVILGDRYHYIFESKQYDNYLINNRLSSDLRKNYRPKFHNCQLKHKHQMVSCEVILMMDVSSLNAKEKSHATALDFFPLNSPYHQLSTSSRLANEWNNQSNKQDIWIAEGKVTGKFYLGDKNITQQASQLNQSYTIILSESIETRDIDKTAFAVLATPVTMLADGVAAIGLATLFAVTDANLCCF